MKMSRFLKKKTAYFFIGIGIACLILGPLLGVLLDKMIVYDRKTEVIHEDSSSYIRDAFAYPVTLAKDQKLIIEIAEYYENSSVTIRIVAKSAYDQAYSLNSAPGGITHLDFVYSEFGWDPYQYYEPSGTGVDTLSLPTNGMYFYIEFMGDRNGDTLISWPGDYYVIVYGANSGPSTSVAFDITIKVDGPGQELNNIFVLIGALIIIIYVMAVLISVLKANYLR